MSAAIGSDRHAVERDVLLAGLSPDPRRFELLAGEHGENLKWDWILERAQTHQVAALLAGCIADTSLAATLPSHVIVALDDERQKASQLGHLVHRALQAIAACLDQAGVRFLVIDSTILLESVYRDLCRRTVDRIDLVVARRDLDCARDQLKRLGYLPQRAPRWLPTSSTGRRLRSLAQGMPLLRHHVTLTGSKRGDLPIDLHWHIGAPSRFRLLPADVWRYTSAAVVAGTFATTLDREATVVRLALRVMSRWRSQLRLPHICDLGWSIKRGHCDPQRLRTVAAAWGATTPLLQAIALVNRVLDLNVGRDLRLSEQISGGWWFDRMTTREAVVDRLRPVEREA